MHQSLHEHGGLYHLYKPPGGNLVHKHKTKKSGRDGRTTRCKVYPNQLNKLKKEENFATSKHNPHFLKLSLRDGANHVIFQPEFPVFPCKW